MFHNLNQKHEVFALDFTNAQNHTLLLFSWISDKKCPTDGLSQSQAIDRQTVRCAFQVPQMQIFWPSTSSKRKMDKLWERSKKPLKKMFGYFFGGMILLSQGMLQFFRKSESEDRSLQFQGLELNYRALRPGRSRGP